MVIFDFFSQNDQNRLNLYTQTFYCHIERKNWTIFMAEPQNLRFREFQAFFGLEGENSNKNKK